MVLRASIIWLGLLVLAIVNGVLRVAVLVPRIGEEPGRVVSTGILCGLIFVVSFFSTRWISPRGSRDALTISGLWVILTVSFEFLAGHYLFGNPWEQLLADYNLPQGRVWILALVTTFVSPLLATRITRRTNT